MGESFKRTREIITTESRPALPRHIKLRHDAGRGRWILLAPERVFEPDEIAANILKLCDGQRTVADIVTQLAADYQATPEQIRSDVIDILQELADKGALTTAPAA